MPVEVILPKVDMDMATGQISRWFVVEGASVKKGDVLFEIETDKAAMDIDAPASGIIRDITGKERIDIPVGHAVAWIYAEGEESETGTAPDREPVSRLAVETSATPTERRAVAPQMPLVQPASTLPDHASVEAEVALTDSVRATPLARRLVRETGIDLAQLAGSGPKGRVVRADVEAAIKALATSSELALQARALQARSSTEALLPDAQSSDPILALFPSGSYDLVPHDAMRRTIARRLVEAKQTIPHFYLSLDCDIDALLSLRGELNAAAPLRDGQPAYRLSVNDLVIKAWARALQDVPDANMSWTEASLVKHRHVDVGVAVSIPGGLITPIIRRAEEKTLSAISNEMRDLATRAKGRKLKPEEYQGGTTSVSNLGMFGIRNFSAVINPPHATILAVGAGEQRAIVRNGAVVVATVMSVTVSTDHRAVDGALAAQLLSSFKGFVETPFALLV